MGESYWSGLYSEVFLMFCHMFKMNEQATWRIPTIKICCCFFRSIVPQTNKIYATGSYLVLMDIIWVVPCIIRAETRAV